MSQEIETEARRLAAAKMSLSDPVGADLPDDLWQQCEEEAKRNIRKRQLLAIMHAALVNTRGRPPTLRGPYVISDEQLDDAIARSERLLVAYGQPKLAHSR